MNKISRKKLKTWLRKSLANHPENDNGLVAYVEAIVGDAEGPVRSFCVVIVRVAFLEDQCYCLGTDVGLTTRNNLRRMPVGNASGWLSSTGLWRCSKFPSIPLGLDPKTKYS